MLLAALRDLQWRRRRFIIGIVGTGVVFAMTLVLTGLSNGFRVEAENTVDSLGIDSYLIKAGAAGPFLGASPLPAADVHVGRANAGCDGRRTTGLLRRRRQTTAVRRGM